MDRDWAASLLKGACGHARVTTTNEFIQSVMDGLDIGAKQYGEHAYRGRDNAREGMAEARDAAAYALMEMAEMQEQFALGNVTEEQVGEAQRHLLGAVVLAVQLDLSFRIARQVRR